MTTETSLPQRLSMSSATNQHVANSLATFFMLNIIILKSKSNNNNKIPTMGNTSSTLVESLFYMKDITESI